MGITNNPTNNFQMADLTCSYSSPNSDLSYFLLAPNVSFSQLVRFFKQTLQLNQVSISNQGIAIENDDALRTVLSTIEQPIHFDLTSIDFESEPVENQPEVEVPKPIEQVEEPAPNPVEDQPNQECFQIGTHLASLLQRVGIELKLSDINSLKEVLDQLPECYRAHAERGFEQGELMNHFVELISAFLHISKEGLCTDINSLMAYLKQKDVKPADPEEKQKQESQPSVPVHPATCDHCQVMIKGIRYKCLQCPDYDLCEACEQIQENETFHDPTHTFAKLRRPRQRFALVSHRPLFARNFVRPARYHQPKVSGCPRIDHLEAKLAQLEKQINQLSNQS